MKLNEHERESLVLFGRPWTEVHQWLDEFAGNSGIGMRHRRFRHHKAGVREAEKLFGEEGALAARLHVISDLKEEGWQEDQHFPESEEDYVRMGFF
jgi:hypothetical protein